MPTYEYACTSCHRHLDVVQSFSDAPLETCEVCGGKLKRVFHPVGIVLKGSGFYATDNRGKKPVAPAPKESKDSSPSSSSESSKTTKSESGTTSESSKTSESKPSKSNDAATS